MKVLVVVIGLLMINGCAIYNAASSCSSEYQRYKDWKEYLDKATENYNTNVNAGNLTIEEKEDMEFDLMDLQVNTNDALLDFEDCKRDYFRGNQFPKNPHGF